MNERRRAVEKRNREGGADGRFLIKSNGKECID
jgi:hypothetical protein